MVLIFLEILKGDHKVGFGEWIEGACVFLLLFHFLCLYLVITGGIKLMTKVGCSLGMFLGGKKKNQTYIFCLF